MTKAETMVMFKILKTTYPNFYKDMGKKEIEETISLWSEMFKDCNTQLVMQSIKELINTFKYPPTIADIKDKMYELSTIKDNKSPSELWEKLNKAISNSAYNSQSEFEKLPDEVKIFVGTPRQLFELSQMPSETVNSVTKGQFLKQIEDIKARKKADKMMLSDTKILIEKAFNKINLLGEGGTNE